MNWNKIINIFIVIFIILNVIIFSTNKYIEHKRYSLSEQRIEQLRDILKSNNYLLYDYIPDFFPMPKIVFESPKIEKEKIISNIFENEVYLTTFSPYSDQYVSETQQLIFQKGNQKGVVKYRGSNSNYIPEEFNLEEIERVGEAFVDAITLSQPKMRLTYKKLMGDTYILEYNEVYQGEILFCSYVNMKISIKGVEEATMLRYIPQNFMGNKKPIVPIDEVLYSFINRVKPEENQLYAIKKLDLGYHIAMDLLSDNIMAEAVPYYRIKLDNEQVYYVNAYTNELRNSE